MKKVLLVEDDKFLLRVYKAKLAEDNIEAVILENGENAVETAKKEKPAVIVLDLVMPKKDGFETFDDLKANESTKNIPVIILTVLGKDEESKFESKMKPNEYLVKTQMNISDVMNVIKKYL